MGKINFSKKNNNKRVNCTFDKMKGHGVQLIFILLSLERSNRHVHESHSACEAINTFDRILSQAMPSEGTTQGRPCS